MEMKRRLGGKTYGKRGHSRWNECKPVYVVKLDLCGTIQLPFIRNSVNEVIKEDPKSANG